MDLNAVKHHSIQYLLAMFNGNVIFELPPCKSSSSPSGARNLEGMDRHYIMDIHGASWWQQTFTILTTWSSVSLATLVILFVQILIVITWKGLLDKRNETEWIDYTTFPFVVGNSPPKDCTLFCKLCKSGPTCLNISNCRIYYSYSNNTKMSRGENHFREHVYHVAKGMYRDFAKKYVASLQSRLQRHWRQLTPL